MDVGKQHLGSRGSDQQGLPADHLQGFYTDKTDRAGTVRADISGFEVNGDERPVCWRERDGPELSAWGHGRSVPTCHTNVRRPLRRDRQADAKVFVISPE